MIVKQVEASILEVIMEFMATKMCQKPWRFEVWIGEAMDLKLIHKLWLIGSNLIKKNFCVWSSYFKM